MSDAQKRPMVTKDVIIRANVNFLVGHVFTLDFVSTDRKRRLGRLARTWVAISGMCVTAKKILWLQYSIVYRARPECRPPGTISCLARGCWRTTGPWFFGTHHSPSVSSQETPSDHSSDLSRLTVTGLHYPAPFHGNFAGQSPRCVILPTQVELAKIVHCSAGPEYHSKPHRTSSVGSSSRTEAGPSSAPPHLVSMLRRAPRSSTARWSAPIRIGTRITPTSLPSSSSSCACLLHPRTLGNSGRSSSPTSIANRPWMAKRRSTKS